MKVSVHNGTAFLADGAKEPEPGLLVDGLADQRQQLQLLHRVRQDVLLVVLHQRADGGGRRVEDVRPVAVDDRPEAVRLGVVGNAFEENTGGAVGERSVDVGGVAGDPAEVGRAEEDVPLDVVEGVLEDEGRGEHVPADGVHHSLRLAGAARGVEDEEGVLRVEPLRLALVVGAVGAHHLVPGQVERLVRGLVGGHSRLVGGLVAIGRGGKVAHQDDGLQGEGAPEDDRHRLVDYGLNVEELFAAEGGVGGDQHRATGVHHAVRQRLRAETGELTREKRNKWSILGL